MSNEKLQSGYPGTEIETNTEAKILLAFIKDNWDLNSVPVAKIDFGAHPTRTNRDNTLNTYRVISNIYDADVGAHVYKFDVPVAIDVYVRDAKSIGLRNNPSPRLVNIETYLRNFIAVNPLGLRSKGVNNMMLTTVRYVEEPRDEISSQNVWYHLVMIVRMYFHMFRVPI
jgi:hypothetical protein